MTEANRRPRCTFRNSRKRRWVPIAIPVALTRRREAEIGDRSY